MNIASALIKQVLTLQDFQTWSVAHKQYFATEYHSLYKIIDKHCEEFHRMPTIEDLKAEPVCVADPIASWAIGRLIYNLRGHPAQRRPALRISLLTPGLDVLHEIENFRAGV